MKQGISFSVWQKWKLPEDLQLTEKTWYETKNQTNGHISQGDQQAYYLQVF